MTGALPSDTVKNPKLNVNPTSLVSFAHSYPMEDPQISSRTLNSINVIKTCSKQTNDFQKDQLKYKTLTVNKIGTPKPKEPKQTLEDEFKDLLLNLSVFEVLAHAPIYNAIVDKYIESLELGKKGSSFIQVEMLKKIKDLGLFTLPCRLGDSKLVDGTKSYLVGIVKNVEVHIGKLKLLEDFYVIDMEKDPATSLLVGRGFLATVSAVINCKKAKITVGEGVTGSIFGVKEIDLGDEEVPYWTTLGKRVSYEPQPSTDDDEDNEDGYVGRFLKGGVWPQLKVSSGGQIWRNIEMDIDMVVGGGGGGGSCVGGEMWVSAVGCWMKDTIVTFKLHYGGVLVRGPVTQYRDYDYVSMDKEKNLLLNLWFDVLVIVGLIALSMERGFLSQKVSGVGRAVKEKSINRNSMNTSSGIGVFMESDDTMNEDTPVGVASAVKEGVTPSVVDMTVEMKKISSLEDTAVLGSFPPLSTPVTTTIGNASGKSSYANVTGKPSGKKLNIHTFLHRGSSTGLFSFQFSSMEGLDAMLENGLWFIRNHLLILKKWHPDENLLKEDVSTIPVWVKLHGVHVTAFSEDGLSCNTPQKSGQRSGMFPSLHAQWPQNEPRLYELKRRLLLKLSSYARVMIELRADVELKDNTVVAMPKIIGEGHYICAGENKTLKKSSQNPRGVPVGPKMGFNPQKEYRPVPNKPTASSSGNKKKGVVPTIEVSNSNPFEVLISVDNDVELGTNRGTNNLLNNEAISSGSSFMNIDNSSTRTTPIIDKIGKFEELLTSGKDTLVDEAGNSLKKVEFPDDYDSEDGVASDDNDMAHSMAS
ncbi:RNA-directed DNA polymerase, eukaryota, reverse transcriptase zinc-binding domain protein [Tanacetum coccineum]